MSNIISNGYSPNAHKEIGVNKVVSLGTLHDHPWAAGLPEGATVYRREDGAVIVKVPTAVRHDKDGKPAKDIPDFSETRVDSASDAAHIAKGRTMWYQPLLDAAEAGAKPVKRS